MPIIFFETPRWLWLLVLCVPMVWLVALAWPVEAGPTRWASAAARSLLLAGMVVAAARPVRVIEKRAVSAVALFDVSASVSDADLARERQLLNQLRLAASPPHGLRVARFATTPTEIAGAVDDNSGRATGGADGTLGRGIDRPPGDEGLATDIGRALGLAAGLGDPTRTRRILLVSDGHATSGDAVGLAAYLAALGIRLDYVALTERAIATDVAITGLSAPIDIRPHATFPLRIDLATDVPALVQLVVKRNGNALDPHQSSREMTIPAGRTAVTWDARLDDTTAPSVFVAEARLVEGRDAHPENDRAILAIASPSPPRALVLSTGAADAAALVAAVRAQSIDVQAVQGEARGAFDAALTAAALTRVDLLALCDLPRAALGDAAIAAIDRYVRDGGGLLVTGGPHAFGAGGWNSGRLESLLPVRLDVPRTQDDPTLALALVIDRSGSMTGPKMDLTKQAARGTAQMLPDDDQIAVIAFDSQATTIVPLQRAANRLRIATNIGRIQPTGGTNILAGLREAVDQLSTARAKKKHAILLSDGQSSAEGIAELVDAAAGARITVSTIGVGDGADDALLEMIARQGGGRYYHTRDPASIPRIFTRETSELTSSGIIERPTTAIPHKRAEMLRGIAWGDSPRLRGYVRTRARAQADILLTSDGAGDPLLARWAVGLGQVVAWTSDLGTRWADDWTRWTSFAQLWGQIARATMRQNAAKEFPLTVRAGGGFVDVSMEAQEVDDVFLAGLDGVAEVTNVRGDGTILDAASARVPTRRVPLVESAPGRYTAHFPLVPRAGVAVSQRTGALMLRVTLSREGRPVAQGHGHVSIPLASELLPRAAIAENSAAGVPMLMTLAQATGGGVLASPADLFRGAAPRPTRQPLRSYILGAMTMLFVADVAFRRLIVARGGRRAR